MSWAGQLLAVATVAGFCGCATIPPSPLGQNASETFRLDTVNVKVASDARVVWANAEDEFVKSRQAGQGSQSKPKAVEAGLTSSGSTSEAQLAEIAASPEAQAFVRTKAAASLRDALAKTLKPELQHGTRVVRLEVTLHLFDVPSAVRRVVVGGMPTIIASADLVDATTGTVLATRPNFAAMAYAGNGWLGVAIDQAMDDLDVRLTNQYAATYRDWLLNKTGI
jgi:hypothetical protein